MDEPNKSAVAKREEEILAFWQKEKIFEQTLAKPSPKGNFVFYDGPPFATGLPHYGHILAGTIKDVIPRYKTMQGFYVRRRWGWDCHGLPLENIVEKELNLAHKKDIENYGIGNFNEQARKSVLRFTDDWKKIIPRLGRFVDMEDDYRSLDPSYSETVWWIFKNLFDQGLIYEGYKAMQICPRCETSLSNFEVNQGYKDVTDISVYIKFKLLSAENTYLVAWTTTPWTLPGNVALAINPKIKYVSVLVGAEKFIVAAERLTLLTAKLWLDQEVKIERELDGTELLGQAYQPVFDYYAKDETLKNRANGWKVYGAPFVSTEEGTGIVHIAPAFGEDDMALGQKENLPFVQHVTMSGTFKEAVTDFPGQEVKPKAEPQKTDIEIIKFLAHSGALLAKEKIVHSYAHCWRCDTPLLNYATSSWFVKVTAFKDQLVAANEEVTWVPEHIKEGRFGRWLEGARDWAISRSRFWGAPLPVWKCQACKEIKVFGAMSDLQAELPPAQNQYWALRHGEADSNLQDLISYKEEASNGLTSLGQSQVATAAANLSAAKIDLIISSPFRRAKESALIVAEKLGLGVDQVIFDQRLEEANPGNLDGCKWSEYSLLSKQTDSGRETLAQIRTRVASLLFDLETRYAGKKILLVSHGLPLKVALLAGRGVPSCDLRQSLDWEASNFNNAEVKTLAFKPYPHNLDFDLDFHRPYIDQVNFPCACGGQMSRVPEVFDCWFESGSMPYAQDHYPFGASQKLIDPKQGIGFPADFIAEGVDQTRGWFYSLLVLGVALFGKSPFKHVVVNGMILAEDGQKMSKSLKNFPDPLMVVDKYGADALRLYLLLAPVVHAEDLNFSEKGLMEVSRRILARLGNVLTFLETYGDLDTEPEALMSQHVLDQWLVARLAQVTQSVSLNLDRYELDRATRELDDFIDDLSNWYVRRSRDRFKSEDQTDRTAANQTLCWTLLELAKLLAPFAPFMAEELYQKLAGSNKLNSVHLAPWPVVSNFDQVIIADMKLARDLVTIGLELRAKAGIKVRQPLASFTLSDQEKLSNQALLALIADELNVKTIKTDGSELALETTLNPDLVAEGLSRELIRLIQDGRKQAGLNPGDLAELNLYLQGSLVSVWDQFADDIKKATNLSMVNLQTQALGEIIKIDQSEVSFELKKLS